MDKAVIGVFADNSSASRAMNDLKANGFGGENLHQTLRDDVIRGEHLPGHRVLPGMEILKGIVFGAIAGAILGAIAYKLLGMSMTWPYTLPSVGFSQAAEWSVVSMAVVGAVCGLVEGLLAMGPMARASHALGMHRRGDAMIAVHTDETHSGRAVEIMRAAGAWDVRRGASSVPGEFQTLQTVEPETYGRPVTVQREAVEAPAGTTEPVIGETDGGAVG
jgi:hypothetical protein